MKSACNTHRQVGATPSDGLVYKICFVATDTVDLMKSIQVYVCEHAKWHAV